MTSCTGEEVTDHVFLPIDVIMLVALSWITVVVAQHDIKWKNATAFDLVDDAKFWVYSLYVVAIGLTVGRYFFVGCTDIDPDYISITYNWAASLIVAISSIAPWRFVLSNKMRVLKFESGNLKYCMCVLFMMAVPLAASAVLLAFDYVPTSTILFVWRVIFMVIVVCEMAVLTCLLAHVHRSVQATNSSLPKSFIYCFSGTLWMRIGIVGSIVLKQTGVLDKRFLKVVHTAFIISGFAFYYHKQLSERAFNSAKASTRGFSRDSNKNNHNSVPQSV